jgi:hypothetical protein
LIRFPVPRTSIALNCASIYVPDATERFETARHRSILHPERIVGNPETVIPPELSANRKESVEIAAFVCLARRLIELVARVPLHISSQVRAERHITRDLR